MITRVLVVDDEPDFVQLMVYHLIGAGCEVLGASNGLDAVRLAQRHLPDVILLDVMMPGLDGFCVCEALGRNVNTARIPVILLTAMNGEAARRRGFDSGAVLYLTKPVHFPGLMATVEEVIQRQRQIFQNAESKLTYVQTSKKR